MQTKFLPIDCSEVKQLIILINFSETEGTLKSSPRRLIIMSKAFVLALLTSIAYLVFVISGCACRGVLLTKDNRFSFERVSKLQDDGHKQVNEITETSVDSNEGHRPKTHHHHTIVVKPSWFVHHKSNEVADMSEQQWAKSSSSSSPSSEPLLFNLDVPLDQFEKQFVKSLSEHGGFRRGFLTKPRAVESPALSVDSGGRATGGTAIRVANAISHAFNVKQGHYSDIYNRLDHHEPLSSIVKQSTIELDDIKHSNRHNSKGVGGWTGNVGGGGHHQRYRLPS